MTLHTAVIDVDRETDHEREFYRTAAVGDLPYPGYVHPTRVVCGAVVTGLFHCTRGHHFDGVCVASSDTAVLARVDFHAATDIAVVAVAR